MDTDCLVKKVEGLQRDNPSSRPASFSNFLINPCQSLEFCRVLAGTTLSSTQVSVCSSEQKHGIWQLPAKSAEFNLHAQSLLSCCMSLRCRGKQRAPPSTRKLAEELEGPKGVLEVFLPARILRESRADLFWNSATTRGPGTLF